MDLKQLCEIHAPSGDEYKLRALLLEEAKKLCGEENVKIDRMGNVLCFKKGTEVGKPHVCVSAHMDEDVRGMKLFFTHKPLAMQNNRIVAESYQKLIRQSLTPMHAPSGPIHRA